MARAFFPELSGGMIATLTIADPDAVLAVAEAQVFISGNNEVTPVPAIGGEEPVGQLMVDVAAGEGRGGPDGDQISVLLLGYALILTSKVTSGEEPAAGDIVYVDVDKNTYSNDATGNTRKGLCLSATAAGTRILLQS